MKKIAVLLFGLCALFGSVHPAEAGNVSWGFPLPFPFLFYKFVNANCNQANGNSKDNGYSKDNAYYQNRPSTLTGFPTRQYCPCIPLALQHHGAYHCKSRLLQPTSLPAAA